MAVTSTVICDRCGHTQADYREPRLIRSISLTIRNGSDYGDLHCRQPLDWCDVCVRDAGLRVSQSEPVKPVTAKPTLEDLVLEIVRRENAKKANKG